MALPKNAHAPGKQPGDVLQPRDNTMLVIFAFALVLIAALAYGFIMRHTNTAFIAPVAQVNTTVIPASNTPSQPAAAQAAPVGSAPPAPANAATNATGR